MRRQRFDTGTDRGDARADCLPSADTDPNTDPEPHADTDTDANPDRAGVDQGAAKGRSGVRRIAGDFAGTTLKVVRPAAATPIANRVLYKTDSSVFHYVGGIGAGPASGVNPTARNYAVNYGTFKASNEYFVEFDTNASVIEVAYHGDGHGDTNRVLVDGQYISTTNSVAPDDAFTYVSRVTLPGPATFRHVRVETLNFNFVGVYLNQDDTIRLPTTSPVRAVIMGDSYTHGASSVAGANDLSNYLAQTAQLLGGRLLQIGCGRHGISGGAEWNAQVPRPVGDRRLSAQARSAGDRGRDQRPARRIAG